MCAARESFEKGRIGGNREEEQRRADPKAGRFHAACNRSRNLAEGHGPDKLTNRWCLKQRLQHGVSHHLAQPDVGPMLYFSSGILDGGQYTRYFNAGPGSDSFGYLRLQPGSAEILNVVSHTNWGHTGGRGDIGNSYCETQLAKKGPLTSWTWYLSRPLVAPGPGKAQPQGLQRTT